MSMGVVRVCGHNSPSWIWKRHVSECCVSPEAAPNSGEGHSNNDTGPH